MKAAILALRVAAQFLRCATKNDDFRNTLKAVSALHDATSSEFIWSMSDEKSGRMIAFRDQAIAANLRKIRGRKLP